MTNAKAMQIVAARINRMLGLPESAWEMIDGRARYNVGSYMVSESNGRAALVRIHNDAGAEATIIHPGKTTADTLAAVHAFAGGIETGRASLLPSLERLAFAAECRDNTMGDPARLIAVKAELSAAAAQAREAMKGDRQ